MDELLTPVRVSKPSSQSRASASEGSSNKTSSREVDSHQEVLEALRSQPDLSSLRAVVKYLEGTRDGRFNIKIPSALTTQILNLLVNDVLPTYWAQLTEDRSLKALLASILDILRSIPAMGAIQTRLKALIKTTERPTEPGEGKFSASNVSALLDLFQRVLIPDDFVTRMWEAIQSIFSEDSYKLSLWRDFISRLSSGVLVSVAAEAESVLMRSNNMTYSGSWVASGNSFARWTARNISHLLLSADLTSPEATSASEYLGKTLSLGYTDIIVKQLLQSLSTKRKDPLPALRVLMRNLAPFQQRSVFSSIIHNLFSRNQLSTADQWSAMDLKNTPRAIASAAGFINSLILDNAVLADNVLDRLTRPESSTMISSSPLLRTCVAALCRDEKRIESLLEKSLEKFSDELFIRHCPITQQEATTQVLLLSSGHIYRKSPMHLITLAKSSKYMNGISNRLNSKSLRARWLGMIVGMTISKLVDKPDNQMHFSDDVLDTPEAKWYKYLPYVDDKISKIDDMQLLFGIQNSDEADPSSSLALLPTAASDAKPSRSTKGRYSGSTRPTGTIVQLVEETDDLIPYAKPDSDPEDDDEDPTLVTRNKPRPPVYIRDLLSGLQEREKYDKHHLALSTAATLIRQKSGFGKEVTDHLDDLTSTLINLNDTFGIPNFLELRQEALIAVLLAQPAEVARYLARIVFEGDFSLQQRTTILVAIGFGARELAGFKDEERAEIPSFPSKQLPDDLAKLYLEAPSSLMSVSARLERTIVEPLAMRVADEASGPNALKVRTFSSRIAVEKARKKPIANKLAKVVADNFFFPLTGPWRAHMYAFGSKGSSSFSGHLLPTYLRTLALLLHASGPNTVSLPQMTAEFWDVLLSVRTSALNDTDYGVLEALLFALLILLEVNENKEMLAREHAKELMETQEWARLVLERIGPQGQEAERVRGLVASVVVRCHEVVERWQRLMVGDLVEF